jgi:hypothetical protein
VADALAVLCVLVVAHAEQRAAVLAAAAAA